MSFVSSTTLYSTQFSETIALLAQQLTSVFAPYAMEDRNFVGERKTYNQVAAVKPTAYTPGDNTPTDSFTYTIRNVFPTAKHDGRLFDWSDGLQAVADPKASGYQAIMAGFGRAYDDIFISALGGTAYTGKLGTTAQTLAAYNSGSQILALADANGAKTMTKLKIMAAKTLFNKAQVPAEGRHIALASEEEDQMLLMTDLTSHDFNIVKPLVEGTVQKRTWLGFEYLRSERLLAKDVSGDDAKTRLCYAWQKTGVQIAIQLSPEARLEQYQTKGYSWHWYVKFQMGGTRMEETKVVQIPCLESVDIPALAD